MKKTTFVVELAFSIDPEGGDPPPSNRAVKEYFELEFSGPFNLIPLPNNKVAAFDDLKVSKVSKVVKGERLKRKKPRRPLKRQRGK